MKKPFTPRRTSELAFVECNSIHGRGKAPEQIAELADFEKRQRSEQIADKRQVRKE